MNTILRPVLELTVMISGLFLAYLPVQTYLKQPPGRLVHGLHLFWQESVSWKEDFVTFLTFLPAQCFFPLCWY